MAVRSDKFRPLLKIVFEDVILSYRKRTSYLVKNATTVQTHFMTESEAAQLMNPFILLPFIKYTIQTPGGFDVLREISMHEIVSMLLVVNTVFYGDFQLKDKYWY